MHRTFHTFSASLYLSFRISLLLPLCIRHLPALSLSLSLALSLSVFPSHTHSVSKYLPPTFFISISLSICIPALSIKHSLCLTHLFFISLSIYLSIYLSILSEHHSLIRLLCPSLICIYIYIYIYTFFYFLSSFISLVLHNRWKKSMLRDIFRPRIFLNKWSSNSTIDFQYCSRLKQSPASSVSRYLIILNDTLLCSLLFSFPLLLSSFSHPSRPHIFSSFSATHILKSHIAFAYFFPSFLPFKISSFLDRSFLPSFLPSSFLPSFLLLFARLFKTPSLTWVFTIGKHYLRVYTLLV